MSHTSSTSPSQTIPLKGMERLFSIPKLGAKIAHIARVHGDMDTLIAEAPKALRLVVARHPKMRAKVAVHSRTAVIASSVPDDQVDALLTVTTAESPSQWQSLVESNCNDIPDDRTRGFPFSLHILRASPSEPSDTARIILFSDHWAADGFSGYRVIHDFLTFATLENPVQAESLQVLPSVVDLIYGKSVGDRTNPLLYLFSFIAAYQFRNFQSVLALSPSLPNVSNPVQPTKSRALFASGKPDNLVAALKRCKEESVTLHGALLASLVAVFARYPRALRKNAKEVAFHFDFDYNMRSRLASPLPKDHVGLYIGIASIDDYASGTRLSEPFWAHARRGKKMTETAMKSTVAALFHRFIHTYMGDAKSLARTCSPLKKSVNSDINFSNIGRYPFPTTHTFPTPLGGGKVDIQGVHLYNSVSGVGNAMVLFVSSVDALDYSLSHRVEETVGETFLGDVVKIFEAIGTVGKDETIEDVVNRVLGGIAVGSDAGGN
ncbi:hypothetical protein HK104_009098 [Borealophlyctis nickersoniae]|nr:hypothetical protein HK104_009098 [Borealophlyctis nickersoniae]